MKDDHDHYIIVVALLPVILFVLMYVMWHGTGEPDISSPNLPTFGISLPPPPDVGLYVPDSVRQLADAVRENAGTVAPALAVGLLIGLLGMGLLIDLARVVWRRAAPVLRRRVKSSSPPELY